MPNWTYLILHFFHTLALGLWIGGSVAVGALTAPAVFRLAPSRAEAGRIMATVFRRFDRVLVGCIGVLALTSALLIDWFGRLSAWYAIEYVCIGMMSASALYSILVVTPRLQRLREQGRGSEVEFTRLHRVSELSMQFNLACAAVALFFS